MTADEIRKLNEDLQNAALRTNSGPMHEAALRSVELSLLAEIAAQLAQLNAGLETITAYQSLRVQVEPGQYPIVVSKNL